MKKLVSTPALYVVAYLLVMLPTYVLPYLGSNSHILRSTGNAINRDMRTGVQMSTGPMWWHLAFLAVLVALAWGRGRVIGKGWLVIFPVLAAFFDMMPGFSMIPLVPTIMHVLAIILGVAVAEAARPLPQHG